MAPVVILLVVFAHPIVVLIYGEKWAAAAPILQALALVMVGSGLYQVAEPYALARGHFKTIAKSKLVEIMVFLPCAYFGARFWGLVGLAVGAGIGYMSSAVMLAYSVRKLGGPKVQWVRQLVATTLSTVPSVLVAWVVQALFEGPQPIETVLMLIAFGTTYLVVLVLFRRALASRILGFARSAFARQADTAGSLGTAEGKS
jgi:O-antigen/teichoic acid export membrane protein